MNKIMTRSLKTRMILVFSGFSVLLALFYWMLLTGFLLFSEDVIFNRQVSAELQRQKNYFAQHSKFDQLPADMRIYLGDEILSHPGYEEIIELPEGSDEAESQNLHVAHSTINGTPVYLTFDVEKHDLDHASITRFNQIALIALLIVSATGVITGIWMGRRTAKPILRLDQRIQSLDKNGDFGETESFGKDEIGSLAQSFAEAYDRSQQFLIREKRFTREVSHELRTPVAVIQGALDILEVQPDNPAALGRIRRAGNKMQQLIDTFLLLGREENLSLSDTMLDCSYVCQMAIEQHQKGASVPIRFQQIADPQLQVLPPVFMVLLNNLLNNAVRHTKSGEINISINREQLTIADTGPGFPPEILSQIGQPYLEGCSGHGLGLSIVQRICQQFSWTLLIDSSPETGSQVHIRFS